MPKLKTRKAVAKRVKVTAKKKVLRRSTGQNHYNSKETGAEGNSKRRDKRLFKTDEKNVLRGIPYAK